MFGTPKKNARSALLSEQITRRENALASRKILFAAHPITAMWDGKGFNDDASKKEGYYATYKLGLFYLLSRTLDKDFDFKKELIERVWLCQLDNGGFKTNYYGNGGFPDCQTNTETTSIILLADVPSLFKYDC